MKFLAIDFETANHHRYSACSVGLVRVEDGLVVQKSMFFIRPPEKWFRFTHIHGLTWQDVKDAPSFHELWPDIKPLFHGVDFLVAHNAPFDRSVLLKTCEYYGIRSPEVDFMCTVQLSRRLLGIYPTKLTDVCTALDIRIDSHHEALSDAMACANIMLHIHEQYPWL